MIALVLGGAGFVGRYMVTHLLSKNEIEHVYSIGRGHLSVPDSKLTHFNKSITSQTLSECLEGKGLENEQLFIFNCSGTGSVGAAHSEPLLDIGNTCFVVAEVLDFVRRYSLEAVFVQVSTAAVYGNSLQLPQRVNDSLAPVSAYGYSNLIAENVVKMYSDIYGVKGAVVRLFSVYGPGLKKQLFWDACNRFKDGGNEFFGTGAELRDWIHVRDAVDILYIAANRLVSTQEKFLLFNGGTGKAVSISEVLNQIAKEFGYSNKVRFMGTAKSGDPQGMQAYNEEDYGINFIDTKSGIVEYVEWFNGVGCA